jgi:rod shape-determining protein MreC
VIEGDLLITSGLGGTFPPGYPVGTIEEVASESGEPFLKISARPSAGLNRIREVLLIWPEPTGARLVEEGATDDESTRTPAPAEENVDAGIAADEPATIDAGDDDETPETVETAAAATEEAA